MKRVLLLLILVGLGTSCVSTDKLTYLQEPEEADSTSYSLQRDLYHVQPNDILSITVRTFDPQTAQLFNAQNTERPGAGGGGDLLFYLQGYSVDLNGLIDMPVVGQLNVAGKTVEEIKSLVQSKLNNYFKADAAYVNVQLAGVRYSVVGDVARPGKYVIYQNQVNIFEAIAQAGDITLVGDRRDVMIVRQTPEGVKTYKVDLTDANVISKPQYFIQPNDIINVKPLPQKSLGIGTTGFQTLASVLGVLASSITLIIALSNLN